jgi:hypothetical protein
MALILSLEQLFEHLGYLAIFGLVTANLFLLLERRWKDLLRLMAAQAGMLILAIPWLLLIPGQITKVQTAFWTPRPILALRYLLYLKKHFLRIFFSNVTLNPSLDN